MNDDGQRPTLAQTIEFLRSADFVLDKADVTGLNVFAVSKARAGVKDAIVRLEHLKEAITDVPQPATDMRHLGGQG